MQKKLSPYRSLLLGVLFVISIIIATTSFPDLPPEIVPPRSVLDSNNLKLLWIREMEIDTHQSYVKLFIPNDKSVVFWSPQTKSIVALEMLTGNVLWEATVPYVSQMRLYDGNFYITSYDWLHRLESAPRDSDRTFPSCSFAGPATVLAFDSATGSQIWGYSYRGVNEYNMVINANSIYLTGSANHGVSESIAQIDRITGTVLERDCYRWPNKRELIRPPADESLQVPPYLVVFEGHEQRQLSRQDISLFFVAHENQLDILDGQTKEVAGSVNFEGAALNSWDINVAVQGNIAVIYFGDSQQLFGFRLSQ